MPEPVLAWSTAIQCVVAGLVLASCAVQASWLRTERGDRSTLGPRWILVWSLALATVSLLNGIATLLPTGAVADAVLLARFVALGAAVVLSLPAIHAFTGGPDVRPLIAATAAWYLFGTVLWVGTDLLYTHSRVDGLPQYGAVATTVDLVPLMAIAVYVAYSLRRTRITAVGAVLSLTGFVSAVLLVASAVPPPSVLSELLRGVWALPLAVGLQILVSSWIGELRRAEVRRSRMRASLARAANAAWIAKDADQVLQGAITESRVVLVDASVDGAVRAVSTDRHVTELFLGSGRELDADEQAYLRDLELIVTTAADRHALTDRLARAAFTDALTRLPNRSALDHHLERVLTAAEGSGTALALLVADLDGLRHANDRHGHAFGDQLLVRAGRYLAQSVAEGAFLARLGSDEFAVVLPDAPGPAELRTLARGLRAGFAPTVDAVTETRLTVGIARWTPGEPADGDTLLRAADEAMHEAKRTHSGVAFYDDRLRTQFTHQRTVRSELEAAVAGGEIIAYFQPLTDAVTLEVVGLEVLARWKHGSELRAPADWLPLAEETGLIVPIGQQMFASARRGMEEFDLPVAVNVAARQLDEPDFVKHVEDSWGTDRWDRLTIEVTESALLYDAQHVRASLLTFAERGARIALDDFGTGYNSLSRLGELPIHTLKIDRAFVHDIGTTEGAAVLRAILALAEAHGFGIVAEGVEQRSELQALIQMGVSVVQGHMLGRPAPGVPSRRGSAPTQRPDAKDGSPMITLAPAVARHWTRPATA
ncbi:putative bifunctional diguanylate cyclase/phosphodiesterase [Actinotalea sp.]|uniref:putative bifunctional diguanylate cyclase/phosphodiesterase n=1 Tax=Actinotalea sp. TaxID=1872145 RepID=UPI003567E552